jgi:hypothetical protein
VGARRLYGVAGFGTLSTCAQAFALELQAFSVLPFQQTTDLVEKLRAQDVAFKELIIPEFNAAGRSARIAVARSVDNDHDAHWLAQRLHRSFGGSVDVNPKFLGWLLLVIGAGPVELSIAQHNATLGENGTLQFCDSPGIGPIR